MLILIVEIIICDIKSYLISMYYMTSFNEKKISLCIGLV